MFIVHELKEGYICKVDGETPNVGDILCLGLYRQQITYFKVKEVIRYAEQSNHDSTLKGYIAKARVERIDKPIK